MFTKTAVLLASLLSVNAFAATTLRNGFYRDEFNHCGMKIQSIEGSSKKSVNYYYTSRIPLMGATGGELIVDGTVNGTTLVAKSPTYADNKIKIELANDGTPVSAKMGRGGFAGLSYEKDCQGLIFIKPL